jgi:hypothetical protein
MSRVDGANSRSRHPTAADWRADALAQSRHSRLTEALLQPRAVDEQRAATICAAICRRVLGDLAPAVLLLPREERLRCQALAAWTAVLFDFAWQRGIEGERLAALSQLQYRLEEVLDGAAPPVQPIFVRMLVEHRRRKWPLASLADLRAVAQRQVTRPPERLQEAVESTGALGRAIVASLIDEPPPEAQALVAGLLRLRALQDLGEGLRQRRPTPVVLRALGPDPRSAPIAAPSREQMEAVIEAECEAIRPLLLTIGASVPELPVEIQRAALYLAFGGIALLTRIEGLSAQADENRPVHLGAWRRIGLLLRARFARY